MAYPSQAHSKIKLCMIDTAIGISPKLYRSDTIWGAFAKGSIFAYSF